MFVILSASCEKEVLFADDTRVNLWLFHQGAEMPVVVEGNTNSKVFIIFVHGGPGGTAQVFNNYFTPFSNALEEDYAVVYWDQRNSGLSRGEWDPEKITIDQYTEDLDQVIELMKFKFGTDITFFLAGNSWGAYLSQAYLLNQDRQSKINAWINIAGLTNRNQDVKDALQKIREIGNEQIALEIEPESWTNLLNLVQEEINKNTQQYDEISENLVFSFIRNAERIIRKSEALTYDFGSAYYSVYRDNSHPFILASNKRVLDILVPQMYTLDNSLSTQLANISLPTLQIYGKFDVRTPISQADFVTNNISTDIADQELIILQTSDHSSVGNEPLLIANAIKDWIEQYK